MSHMHLKLSIAASVIATAVVFLAVAGVRDGWVYYMPVDQFIEDGSPDGVRVRLHGTVAEGYQANASLLTAKFDLLGETHQLPIEYEGVIPDMFQAEREVVVEGEFASDAGVFRADSLLTKCASKYEGGDAPHADPRAQEAIE